MKKKLLKVIGISFLIFVVLSWIIPVGIYSNGELSTNGIDPIGLFDLFNTPIQAILSFASVYGAPLVAIGGLYGVMEKTGALEKVVSKMVNAFMGKERGFLILTVLLFVILSSVTGLVIPLFVLVPLFAAVLFAMNYDKLTVLASTIGSLIVGSIASTYGINISGYTHSILALDINNQIVAKLILLVLLVIALIFVILTSSKRTTNKSLKEAKVVKDKKEVEMKSSTKVSDNKKAKKSASKTSNVKASTKKSTTSKTTVKKSTAKKSTAKKSTKASTKALAVSKPIKKISEKAKISAIPLVIIFLFTVILCLVGMYNWSDMLGIEVFSDFHEAVMEVEIEDFPIFAHLLSGITAIGSWNNLHFAGAMLIAACVIAWIYKFSFDEFIDSFVSGVKKWLPTACLVSLAGVILMIVGPAIASYYSATGTVADTINAKIFELTDGFNVLTTGFASLIGSFFFNDYQYFIYDIGSFINTFDAAALSNAGLLVQSVFGVGMLILPTSFILIAGLSLFDVSYKEWMKYIWKFALIAFLLILLTCGIITLL